MLNIVFEDHMMTQCLPEQTVVTCDACGKEAFVFQDEGNFCLDCWQDRTEPNIAFQELINKSKTDTERLRPPRIGFCAPGACKVPHVI